MMRYILYIFLILSVGACRRYGLPSSASLSGSDNSAADDILHMEYGNGDESIRWLEAKSSLINTYVEGAKPVLYGSSKCVFRLVVTFEGGTYYHSKELAEKIGVVSRRKTKRFYEIARRNGDMNYQGKVLTLNWLSPEFEKDLVSCLTVPIRRIKVWADVDLDEKHPAGSLLNDELEITVPRYADIIASGYRTLDTRGDTVDEMNIDYCGSYSVSPYYCTDYEGWGWDCLARLTEEDMRISPTTISMYSPNFKWCYRRYRCYVEIEMADGTVHRTSTEMK